MVSQESSVGFSLENYKLKYFFLSMIENNFIFFNSEDSILGNSTLGPIGKTHPVVTP